MRIVIEIRKDTFYDFIWSLKTTKKVKMITHRHRSAHVKMN